MAPAPQDRLSPPGGAGYGSDTMSVGDGTWDLSRNTFLLPNLQGVNFETMRYNGMGNRFASLDQYHRIVLAHAILGALVFLLIVPAAIMTVRFYARRPGYAVIFHAQMQVLAGLMLLAVFILGYFAVGPSRSLTNPHHGIGVAIFVLFILQLVGGRLVRHIVKLRSLRVMVHQWSGRAIALLGIVQVPLGLTLYGSPKYIFVLYALWMTFLLLVYFALSYRSAGNREIYMSGGAARSEAGHTRITESEHFSNHPRAGPGTGLKWLGPLAALGGLAAASGHSKQRERSRSRSRARSRSYSRGDAAHSRRGSESYLSDKYTELPPPSTHHDQRGGFMKTVQGAAAALGVAKLVSGLTGRRRSGRDDDYSAVSTETPRRHRVGRGALAPTASEFSSDYTDNYRRRLHDGTNTSFLPPSANPPAPVGDAHQRPTTPRPMYARSAADHDDSDYTSYVSPSRRRSERGGGGSGSGGGGGGFAKGILSGLGVGWFAKKMADRRNRREDDARLREEEELRAGAQGSRFTGDGHPSPTRRHRPPPTGRTARDEDVSELTESSMMAPPSVPRHGRPRSRHDVEHVSMPHMPPDPETPQRRNSSRRRREGERAAAAAAARASDLAADQDHAREAQQAPPPPQVQQTPSGPLSVKLKVHDDRDRNVTLRRLTDEEAARASRGYGHGDSEGSVSGLESPGHSRRYRRGESQQGRMERAAERAVERRADEEQDQLAPLSPPQPSYAKTGRRGAKDSAYYSGPAAGPSASGAAPAPSQTVSSWVGDSPDSHATWSQMSLKPTESAAEDRRRRRRQERRAAAASTSSRPSGQDMFE
ncbi:hypothetical protein L249_2942 [Ophiocordyceps polyrhachis-furcata BCC 54312]|uniref:Cytochrome b561 domain-containing protein n=1 Tax=Ophiocordyceps polyrhachis-furcata BCC 54312 TaxID=1330021 RepID=A0A367LQM5_9HYPO|nr:hypothetical protein L249_2942 [Ophiocordyceps polyrhachis-furcata BCC 54312]